MIAPIIAAVLTAMAVMAVVSVVFGELGMTRRRALERAMRIRSGPVQAQVAVPPPVTTSLLRRDAYAGNESISAFFRQFDWAHRRAELMDRADVPLKVSEYVLIVGVSTAIVALGLIALTGFLPAGLVGGLGVILVGEWYVHSRANGRVNKFNEQLPTALQMMAVSLQSGFSIADAIRTVAEDLDAPLSTEFSRILAESRAGGSFEDSLHRLHERIDTPDLQIAIQALTVHARVGGNLGEILEQVATTMREREELRREIRSLTAQERISANIVALLPIWVLGIMFFMSRETVEILWTTSTGHWMALAAICFEVVGFLLTRRVTKVEV